MITLAELAALLYGADPGRLSLAARVTWHEDGAAVRRRRERKAEALRRRLPALPAGVPGPAQWPAPDTDREWQILLAPGGRYRIEYPDGTLHAVGDGESGWLVAGGTATALAGAEALAEFHGLLQPGWLLASYELEVTGETADAGRPGWRVTGTPRTVTERGLASEDELVDRIEVTADAGLGLLLRAERVIDDTAMTVAQLHDLVLSPPRAGDPGLFRLPPGVTAEPGEWDTEQPRSSGRGAQAADVAASVAAAAMGFAAKRAPRKRPRRDPGDAEAAMPSDVRHGPPPAEARTPVTPAVVALLHRAGRPAPALAAEFHQWLDAAGYLLALDGFRSQLPRALDGVLGPDALWAAIAERAAADLTEHRAAGLRVAMPGRYRLDYRSGEWKTRATAVACDGTRTRRIFADRVAVGPAVPLRKEISPLLDPAWLLSGWVLTEAGPAQVAGRPGLRVVAESASPFETGLGATVAEAVVDPELAILLRWTSWAGDRPLERTELRAVVPGDPAPGAAAARVYGADAGPGLREVPDSIGPLSDRDLPALVQQAGTAAMLAAGGLAAGAVAVTGWLEKHRARRGAP